jgi:hypothetical protein
MSGEQWRRLSHAALSTASGHSAETAARHFESALERARG